MISKILQILGLQPWISKVFSRSLEQFFLTVGQNNFGKKIPINVQRKIQILSPYLGWDYRPKCEIRYLTLWCTISKHLNRTLVWIWISFHLINYMYSHEYLTPQYLSDLIKYIIWLQNNTRIFLWRKLCRSNDIVTVNF